MSGAPVNIRARTACSSCTRRKVRCSKTTPCDNCIRRGEQATCGPDLSGPSPPQGRAASYRDSTAGELDFLRSRVAELESQARQMCTDASHRPSPAASEAGISPFAAEQPSALGAEAVADPNFPRHGQAVIDTTGSDEEEDTSVGIGENYGHSDKDQRDMSDTVIKDAASILEFLAWGRRKDPEHHPSSRRSSSGIASAVVPEDILDVDSIAATVAVSSPEEDAASGDVGHSFRGAKLDGLSGRGSFLENGSQSLAVMQLLIPNRRQVYQLAEYHHEGLLWYHASYFAPRFQADLARFYDLYGGSIEAPGVDLQWVALLFAVLVGSLTCAPAAQALTWGFREPERHTLCKHWFQAALGCLNRDQYMANHSILSCQAIATMTISAHLLGFSNTQSIQLAAAVRIAQSLGLHRLEDRQKGSSQIEIEMGRRVWNQLCSQDWFSIPFSESYLVNPLHAQTSKPANCHDADLSTPLPDYEPTITGYCRFLNTVASIMPQLQDGLLACNTAYTRYEQVLAWDARMRTLATAERPLYLSSQIPLQPHWPCWIPWARRALAISSGHKIIMIHRSCLSESFTNPAFAFTRHTCIAASKTIIKEYKAVVREDGPTLWVHQAFAVAASIILILDALHRKPAEREHVEHKQLVEDVVDILHQFRSSMIAVRGIKLLRALLDEVASWTAATARAGAEKPLGNNTNRSIDNYRKRKRKSTAGISASGPTHSLSHPSASSFVTSTNGRAKGFNVPAFIHRFCQGSGSPAHQRQPALQSSRRGQFTAGINPQASTEVASTVSISAGDTAAGAVGSRTGVGSLMDPSLTENNSNSPSCELSRSDIIANFDSEYDHHTVVDSTQGTSCQLDASFFPPLGWEGTNNGFENLLYLANHGLSEL